MKFLLVLIVVMVGVWIWRSNRAADRAESLREDARPRRKAQGAIAMGRCDLCGVHCPSDDLLAGERGVYCSTEHRKQAEA
ncbi:MAG: PP0621 family protein [Betaproteobacteria bacterium]